MHITSVGDAVGTLLSFWHFLLLGYLHSPSSCWPGVLPRVQRLVMEQCLGYIDVMVHCPGYIDVMVQYLGYSEVMVRCLRYIIFWSASRVQWSYDILSRIVTSHGSLAVAHYHGTEVIFVIVHYPGYSASHNINSRISNFSNFQIYFLVETLPSGLADNVLFPGKTVSEYRFFFGYKFLLSTNFFLSINYYGILNAVWNETMTSCFSTQQKENWWSDEGDDNVKWQ